MDIVEIDSLVVKYKDFIAVDKIKLDIKQGEIFGFLGPNGAGKTSTLESIEGLIEYEGTIKVLGYDPKKDRLKLQEQIGILLQGTNYFKQLSVDEIVKLFASFYKNSNYDELINIFLPDKKNVHFKKLSSGQKQRLAIILTFINNPKLSILDEPSTGLDIQSKRMFWDFLKSQRENKKTIIIATHNMDEVEKLCDRFVILDRGKILEIDSPKNLINKYKNKKTEYEIRNLEDIFVYLTGRGLRD
ncbi:MAG: ABC transporter ATP-binding protein [Clostridiales bacterium]